MHGFDSYELIKCILLKKKIALVEIICKFIIFVLSVSVHFSKNEVWCYCGILCDGLKLQWRMSFIRTAVINRNISSELRICPQPSFDTSSRLCLH